MAIKTTFTDRDVSDFVQTYVENTQKRADSFRLISLMSERSGCAPKMWGPTIIGFGAYHYQYASGHEGDAPILAFSPRKAAISLYVYSDTERSKALLSELGKFKMGKACIDIKKLADIHEPVLQALCEETMTYIQQHHQCSCKK